MALLSCLLWGQALQLLPHRCSHRLQAAWCVVPPRCVLGTGETSLEDLAAHLPSEVAYRSQGKHSFVLCARL